VTDPFAYDIPSAAGGDHGMEGLDVEIGDRRIGRVASLNETPDGLVLLIDTGDAYRPIPAAFIESIESVGHAVRLGNDAERAFAGAPEIESRVRNADTPQLIRHIPAQFQHLVVAGQPRRARSRLWYVGAPLIVIGGVGLMAGPILTAEGVGGRLRWVWVAAPLIVLGLGAWAFWAAMSRDSPRRLTRREKLSDAVTAVVGITPRTRRRG
jgi:hypothetical protein